MGDAAQQGICHFRVAKYLHSFVERQIRGDDQRGLFVKLADQMTV